MGESISGEECPGWANVMEWEGSVSIKNKIVDEKERNSSREPSL